MHWRLDDVQGLPARIYDELVQFLEQQLDPE